MKINYDAKYKSNSVDIEKIEEITGGTFYKIDLDKNIFWLSPKASKIGSKKAGYSIPLEEHINSLSSSKVLVDDKYISIDDIGDFSDIYKLNGVTENKNDSFKSLVDTPAGKIYINNLYNIYVENNKPVYIEGLILNVTSEENARETTKKITTSQKVGGIGNWEYDVASDEVWVSKHVADVLKLENVSIDGVVLNKEQYCKLYERMNFITDNGIKKFEDYNNSFLDMWNIDEDDIKDKYTIEYFYTIGGVKRYSTSIGKATVENGKLIKMIGISQSITAYKEKEFELNSAYEKLKIAEEITNIGSWEIDFIKDKVWCSAFTAKMNGFNSGKHIIMDINSFVKLSKGSTEAVRRKDGIEYRTFEELIGLFVPKGKKNGDIYNIEYEIVKDDGNIEYWKSTVRVNFKDDMLHMLHVTSGEVTEEKLKQKELIKAKEDAEYAAAKQLIAEDIALCGSWEYLIEERELVLSKNSLKRMNVETDEPNLTMSLDQYIQNVKHSYIAQRDGEIIDNSIMEKHREPLLAILDVDMEGLDNTELLKDKYSVEFTNHFNSTVLINTAKPIIENGKLIKFIGSTKDVTVERVRERELIEAKEIAEYATSKQLIAENVALCGSWEYNFEKRELILSKNTLKRMNVHIDEPNIRMNLEDYMATVSATHKILGRDKIVDNNLVIKQKEPMLAIFGIENIDDLSKLEDSYTVEFQNTSNGITIKNYATPIVEDGKLVKFIGSTKDITIERKREDELIKAIEKAEEATAQQSRFVANMSHEIRTPLNAILGYAEIMKEQNLDKKLDLYLKSIDTAGNSLLSLVNDILDYSKVKANKFSATYIPALIGDFCEELKVLFYHKITQKNLDFDIIYDTELPTFLMPVATMRQVLINILGNASKFTHEGVIVLKADASENEDGTYDIDISVRDTGIGIPKNKLETIFKEFEQADESHEKQGTGLGLALSFNFARLIGASVSVDSEVGKGSTFILHMKNVKLASNEVQALHHTKSSEKIKFFGQKALVLDDIADNREVLSAHCKFLNLEAKSYEDGGSALRGLRTFKPDVILTDLRMPTMSGEDFAKNVRALDEFASVPIICITASINPEENYHLENFDEVLNKPIGSHKLSGSISKYLEFEVISDDSKLSKSFNLQNAFRNLEMTDSDFARFKARSYEEIKKLRIGINPKKVKEGSVELAKFAEDTNNQLLKEIVENLIIYSDSLDISNIMECVTLFNKFIEDRSV